LSGVNRVAVRFKDGRVMKGTTQDFVPGKPFMHLHTGDSSEAVVIEIEELKAIFFVKDFAGNPEYSECKVFPEQIPSSKGRKIVVVFTDNEVMTGYTFGYDPGRSGFFVVPTDEMSNNDRAFVIRSAVKEVGLGLKADQILAKSI
jgi:small nuclear ribonucleoprotein (snRNP)-like protein